MKNLRRGVSSSSCWNKWQWIVVVRARRAFCSIASPHEIRIVDLPPASPWNGAVIPRSFGLLIFRQIKCPVGVNSSSSCRALSFMNLSLLSFLPRCYLVPALQSNTVPSNDRVSAEFFSSSGADGEILASGIGTSLIALFLIRTLGVLADSIEVDLMRWIALAVFRYLEL